MPTQAKPRHDHSPLSILTELAVEGTSSFVEAQRALLDLAQQEKDIVLNGVKERVAGFVPAAAMTDVVRRSIDTLIGMQQELLTTTSKQSLHWLESETAGKGGRAAHLLDFAREGVETLARAQKKFLDVLTQESEKAMSGKKEHEATPVKQTELRQLAREAGNAFIEAQKRLLDVMGQQMNVNLDAATRTAELMSLSRLAPMAALATEGVKSFFDAETSLVGSLIKARKPTVVARGTKGRNRARHRQKAVPA